MKTLPIDLLHEILELRNGELFWKAPRSNRLRVGQRAGYISSWGYRYICIGQMKISEHRVIFAMANGRWPEGEIDHINLNKSDNRPENLREVSRQQNTHNVPMHKDNRSGAKGVVWHAGKWRVRIFVAGKSIHLGRHSDKDLAKFIYECAARKYHGQFGRSTTESLA